MSRIVAWVKEHPYEALGSIVAVLTLWLLLRGARGSSGNSDAAAYYSAQASEVAANNQYQMAALAANQQSQQVQAQAAVANNQIGAQLAAVQIQANSSENIAGITAAQNEILAQLAAQTTQVVSTLQANVANNQTAADVEKTMLNDNALITVASLPYLNVGAAQITKLQNEINGQQGEFNTLTHHLSAFESSVQNPAEVGKFNLNSSAGYNIANNAQLTSPTPPGA